MSKRYVGWQLPADSGPSGPQSGPPVCATIVVSAAHRPPAFPTMLQTEQWSGAVAVLNVLAALSLVAHSGRVHPGLIYEPQRRPSFRRETSSALVERLATMSLRSVDTDGDGHCLFHALCDQMLHHGLFSVDDLRTIARQRFTDGIRLDRRLCQYGQHCRHYQSACRICRLRLASPSEIDSVIEQCDMSSPLFRTIIAWSLRHVMAKYLLAHRNVTTGTVGHNATGRVTLGDLVVIESLAYRTTSGNITLESLLERLEYFATDFGGETVLVAWAQLFYPPITDLPPLRRTHCSTPQLTVAFSSTHVHYSSTRQISYVNHTRNHPRRAKQTKHPKLMACLNALLRFCTNGVLCGEPYE